MSRRLSERSMSRQMIGFPFFWFARSLLFRSVSLIEASVRYRSVSDAPTAMFCLFRTSAPSLAGPQQYQTRNPRRSSTRMTRQTFLVSASANAKYKYG